MAARFAEALQPAATVDDNPAPIAGSMKPEAAADAVPAPRTSKQTAIVALMQRPSGASITDLIDATGWLPHTTRAALSGLRKKGIDHRPERSRAGRRVGLPHRYGRAVAA